MTIILYVVLPVVLALISGLFVPEVRKILNLEKLPEIKQEMPENKSVDN